MNADTYSRLAEQCEDIAQQLKGAEDQRHAYARSLAIYYLRYARRELAELAKAIGQEHG